LGLKRVKTVAKNSASALNVAAVLPWGSDLDTCSVCCEGFDNFRDVDRSFAVGVQDTGETKMLKPTLV
jgi:hypothetical protein